MTIKALPDPCFIEAGQRDGGHLLDGRSRDHPERLPKPCFVAACDGIPSQPCGEVLGVAEYDEAHYESASQAIAALRDEDWEWLAIFAAVRCPQCRDQLEASTTAAEGAAT